MNGATRFCRGLLDYADVQVPNYNWMYTVYRNVQEEISDRHPTPLRKEVIITSYVDANLYHDITMGWSMMGILHFLNSTPIDWFSKCQATVETATYGSEFVAGRIATDQMIDIQTTL